MEWDNALSRAKDGLDWDKMISLCVDPEKHGPIAIPATQATVHVQHLRGILRDPQIEKRGGK